MCITLLTSQLNTISADTQQSSVQVQQDTQASTEETTVSNSNASVSKNSTENSSQSEQTTTESKEDQTTKDIKSYIQNGKICIYNYEQLKQVGTKKTIHTGDKEGKIGTGEEVKQDGKTLTYQSDGDYLLMNDIEMDTKEVFTISESFTGTITGEKVGKDEKSELYDKEKDTIYIYNPYQLMVLAEEDSEKEPVMSLDYEAKKFGMGQMIYPDGEDKDYLTYSKKHHYILSVKFNSDKPKLEANQVQTLSADDEYEGRDFNGQVVKTIGDKKYILIGNEEQLRKIGSGDKVYGAVYQAYLHLGKWYVDTDSDGNAIMLYGGDADLKKDQNQTADYTFGEKGIQKADKKLGVQGNGTESGIGRCGVDQKTGKIDPDLDIEKAANATYDSNANYIIFRDIKLTSNWTPLMFSGNMIGAKSTGQSTLWSNDTSVEDYSKATAISEQAARPVISNITVDQEENVDVATFMGVGFFATISSEASDTDVGLSKGTVKVSNIELSDGTVTNNADKAYANQTVVSGLLSGLGSVLGLTLDVLLGLVSFGNIKLNLKDTLNNLLNARAADKTSLATGAFAGRIVGDVEVTKCQVSNIKVTSKHDQIGGFVGYTEGKTQYSGLSNALGDVVKLLSSLLNIIPGLGLGDLITILLGNAIPLDKLIPTGYINAKVEDCTVSGLTGTIGNSGLKKIGGFIGQQTGSFIKNCKITGSNYKIVGDDYVGGFSGLSRDGEIKGTLSDGLNIDLKHFGLPASLLYQSEITDTDFSVDGKNYVGGFVGAQAYTDAINCKIDTGKNALNITGTGDCVGGFAGIETIGWLTNLGKDEVSDASLLKVVTSLLTGLLSEHGTNIALLSLVGVAPSAISGCQINSGGLTVTTSGNYAGGMAGKVDASYIGDSSKDQVEKLVFWEKGVINEYPAEQSSTVNQLESVMAENYAGGVAGSIGTASVAGLLNSTVGVASFLGFDVNKVTVNGIHDGYSVSAKENCAGGCFGEAIGGTINDVSTKNLKEVKANNISAGFVGITGTGSLASTGGLTINLLGLNNLLKVSNLLSVGQGIEVKATKCAVTGIKDGYTVTAQGTKTDGDTTDYVAGGFAARAHSVKLDQCEVSNVKEVKAADDGGYAGGFLGISKTGGLAEVADKDSINQLVDINGLLNAVTYLIPKYTNCIVRYTNNGGVSADTAGGFVADFQSGTINNKSRGEEDAYCVYDLSYVKGRSYAGGFGGKVYSGALADAAKGISILGSTSLSVNISQLLSVINVYVPYIKYAGVKADHGFSVEASKVTSDTTVGSAGGFVGYASGAQISYSDVTKLKHTTVSAPDDLEDSEASSYFTTNSSYAVKGGRYAGGYIGDMDIGSAASVGGGLKVLGTSIQLTNILSALSVVVTTIEHSDVTGATGGYAVLATGDQDSGKTGISGGYAGAVYGGHIQDSQANNFSYVIGQIASGGYVGETKPGDVAKVLDNSSILGKLVNTDETLASLLQTFVPTIRNSSTNCIPCGGVVRAQGVSDTTIQRGMAGGYIGHNMGSQILGLDTSVWKDENDLTNLKKTYNGPTSICKAERIRSVYGQEYAGGYTGFMECADTAKVGGLKLLDGLISIDNLLGALGVIYPIQTNTAVYGPLEGLDKDTWNSWVKYVGKHGGYGSELAKSGTVNTQEELDKKLEKYTYGYDVVAGRDTYDSQLENDGGDAGGYIGLMSSGTLTNCMAYDTKLVKARHASGGYVGQMKTGGATKLGTVSILGLNLNVGKLLNIAQLFVPVIRNSSVQGFQSGLTVQSTQADHGGYAGGFAGCVYGAQIQLNGEKQLPSTANWKSTSKYPAPEASCNATNLRRITGRKAVGGYVGLASAASVADVNTNASNGLLQGVLDHLISTPSDLANVLQASATTIHSAKVSAADSTWGFVVDGAYKEGNETKYASYAGGFAGSLEASAVGEKSATTDKITVKNLRRVDGGKYVGGFFGLADVAGVAQVSGKDPDDGETKLLSGLIKLGNTSVLDAFRTYIYHSSVDGIDEGSVIEAHDSSKEATQNETRYTGCAGGFGAAMMDGTVKDSKASKVGTVKAQNYTGGFLGHLGKSGVADIDDVSVLNKLLTGTVGALDLFGAHIEDCKVSSASSGTVIKAVATGNDSAPIAGGFVGYADLAHMKNCETDGLKKVESNQIAGGFIGKTDMNYIVSTQLQSNLLNVVLKIVNKLLDLLYVGDLENLGLIDINLGPILQLQVLKDGNTLYVDLLGLRIGVALNKDAGANQTDVAVISIGDSTIELPCTKDGVSSDDVPNVKINLIKGNRTVVENSTVKGIQKGYDVFAGGASDSSDGENEKGISGGFVGLNHEGKLENNTMILCDVVRGTKDQVGPFTGINDLKSVYTFNTIKSIEGKGNQYSIYRTFNSTLSKADTVKNVLISSSTKDTTTSTAYNRYDIKHLDIIQSFSDLKDAVMEDDSGDKKQELNAYISPAKAVLMGDTKNSDNEESTTSEPADQADPCRKSIDLTIQKIWKDFGNVEGKRPDEIKVKIYQQKFDLDGNAVGEKVAYGDTVTITKDDKETGSSATWRKVIENVPVAQYQKDADGNITDEIEYYYQYTFEEESVDGYETDYSYNETTYQETITNKHYPKLPDTGDMGRYLFYLIGILLLGLYIAMRRKKRKEQQQAEQLYTTNQPSDKEKEKGL